MRIGFVYPAMRAGDKIRTDAVRAHLQAEGHSVIDVNLGKLAAAQRSSAGARLRNRAESALSIPIWVIDRMLGSELRTGERIRLLRRRIGDVAERLSREAKRFDILHAETHIAGAICSKVKTVMGKGYVFDMHGLMAEEAQGHGEPARLAEAWKGLEKDVVNGADYVIVVSNAMKRMVCASYGKPPDKVIVAANGSDVYPRPAHFAMPFKIVYAGNFAYYEGVWDFIRTAETVPCEKHEFVLIGDGVLKRDLLRYVGGRHLNVIYRGRRTREETLAMLSESQVGIAPSTKDIVRQVACPLKVLDYAACGLPVVTVDVGEWSDTIREYDCGIVTDESDPAAFADAIRRLEDEDLWRRKSSNGRYMVGEKFTWSRVLQPMLALYRG